MLYADDAGFVSQSPEQLRKVMGVIVVVCATFALTLSEAKTEIMCLRAKGMPESTAICSVGAAGQVYKQTNKFVYLGGNVNHNAELCIEVDRRIRNAWCRFRKYTLELYDRPSAPLELKLRMLRAEALETMLYGCITWSPHACHYDTLRRAHHRFLNRCVGRRKHSCADHSISDLDTLIKTGSGSFEATLRSRRILFAGICGALGGYKTAEVRDVQRIGGGRGLWGGQEKEWVGCFLDDLRAFGIDDDQWTTAARDEGEWRRTAEQGAEHFMAKWVAAEEARDGWRHQVVCPNVTVRTTERVAMTSFSGVTFVLFLLRFRFYAFVEAAALRSIVLRYAGAPIATRVSFFFPFVYLEMSRFPSLFCTIHCRFLFVWRVRRTFFPSGWCFSTL